jgi:hypothetical protein
MLSWAAAETGRLGQEGVSVGVGVCEKGRMRM